MVCAWLLTLALGGVVAALVYIYLTWNFGFWKKRGVKELKSVPLYGSYPSAFTHKRSVAYDIDDIYNQFKHDENYVGVFSSRTPELLILSPELAHQVYVTAFKSFHDNDISLLIDKKVDPIFANNPFVLTGEEWKERRAEITPGLTSSRIKTTYPVTQQACKSLSTYIKEQSRISTKDGIDGKELCLSFTTEVVTDCVLGIKAGSFTANPTPIMSMAKKIFEQTFFFIFYNILVAVFPLIKNLYKARFIAKPVEKFFVALMQDAIDLRKLEKIERNDFLNYLLQLQNKKNLTTAELASHTLTFLLDGFETSSLALAHCLLLLARNKNTQDILRKEILQHLDKNGEISFDDLHELPYLDACLHEAIRIFSPQMFSKKLCTAPFEFSNKNGRTLQVNVGDVIVIPVHSLHHDKDYYPNPEKFKPERFLPENGGKKQFSEMGVYLAFGDGPRMCLGMRFALTQTKAAIVEVIKNFNVKVNRKTRTDNQLSPTYFLALLDGGIWLDFEERI